MFGVSPYWKLKNQKGGKTMKKLLVLFGVFLFSITFGDSYVMAAQPAEEVECVAPCIDSFEIVDGQVGSVDIADGNVNTADVADGAVTDAKITGPVSASKIEQGSGSGLDADLLDGLDSSDLSKKPAQVVVVAQSGGDFTSIQAAIDSISPSASNPYVIEVKPGTYVENISMKSYIHLQGSGREVTTIESPSSDVGYDVITLGSHTDVSISGLTIKGGYEGIRNVSSSLTITGNKIIGNTNAGIINVTSSSAEITGNIISGNNIGIFDVYSSATITGNTVTGNNSRGIDSDHSSLTIIGNTLTGNGNAIVCGYSSCTITGNYIADNAYQGVYNYYSPSGTVIGNTITGQGGWGIWIQWSSPMIIHNRITDNGGMSIRDIYINPNSTPHISFNVYDTIDGDTGVGMYNLKSDGTPW
jgi:parallel beta-helix repeat protein